MSDEVSDVPPKENVQTPAVSGAEMRRCAEVLSAIVEDRGLLVQLSQEDRKKLVSAAGRVSRPSRDDERRLRRTFNKVQKNQERTADRLAKSETGIRSARETAVFVAPAQLTASDFNPETQYRELKKPKNCYVCKEDFLKLHFFYDAMCPACAEFNYAKRFQSARLDGWTAVITGSRLKIGYHAALKMLRAGARVIATTRFPHDSALRYSKEPDFAEWRERLHVHGLDLRHSPSVEIFTRYLNTRFDKLDILINNAAQTVRRPVGFYKHLLEFESLSWRELPAELRPILQAHEDCKAALVSGDQLHLDGPEERPDSTGLATLGETSGAGMGIRASAALSQVRYTYDDAQSGRDVFPEGKTDADLQQVDLRTQNSWRMALADVPTPEMLEVQLVNAVAPFILCSKLKPLMLRDPTGDRPHRQRLGDGRHFFARHQDRQAPAHEHGQGRAEHDDADRPRRTTRHDGIFMNAVDTGWVTDEDPRRTPRASASEHDFQPPLDIVDGAARVCDPFFAGLISGEHVWGKFLKDYKAGSW